MKPLCLFCRQEVSTARNIYCSLQCIQDDAWKKRKEIISLTKKVGDPRQARRYLKDIFGNQCQICKNTTWMGNIIPLILDHIDGHSENNNLENLRLVCGNCDMLLPTYKSKNRGNGRFLRRKRYQEGKSY